MIAPVKFICKDTLARDSKAHHPTALMYELCTFTHSIGLTKLWSSYMLMPIFNRHLHVVAVLVVSFKIGCN